MGYSKEFQQMLMGTTKKKKEEEEDIAPALSRSDFEGSGYSSDFKSALTTGRGVNGKSLLESLFGERQEVSAPIGADRRTGMEFDSALSSTYEALVAKQNAGEDFTEELKAYQTAYDEYYGYFSEENLDRLLKEAEKQRDAKAKDPEWLKAAVALEQNLYSPDAFKYKEEADKHQKELDDIKAWEQAIKNDKESAKYIKYMTLAGKEDFEQYSTKETWLNDFVKELGDSKHTNSEAQISEDELAIYNYLYNKEGKEKADEFYEFLEGYALTGRQGLAKAEYIQGMGAFGETTRSITSNYGAGLQDWVGGMKSLFTGDPADQTANQIAASILTEEAGPVASKVYGAARTVGNMTPSILISKGAGAVSGALGASAEVASKIGQTAGALSMGTSASGNAYAQKIEEGWDEGKARTYGLLVGASEAGLQTALGGIGSLGGVSEGALANWANSLNNSFARLAATGAIKIGGEIAEEELQLWIEPALASIVGGEDFEKPTSGEMLDTAIITALSTAALEAPGMAKVEIDYNKYGKMVQQQYGWKELAERAKKLGGDTASAKIAEKLEAEPYNVSYSDIGRLQVQMAQDGLFSKLTENEQKVVDAIYAKETEGKELSKKEQEKIRNDIIREMDEGNISADYIESVLGGEEYTAYQDTLKTENDALQELIGLYKGEELDAEVKKFVENSESRKLKAQLSENISGMLKGEKLYESYREVERAKQKFTADVSKYDKKYQATIQRAIDSGTVNNSRYAHRMVETVARFEAHLGAQFDFSNTEKINAAGYGVKGKITDGYVDEKGNITINMQSPKVWNFIVGHEITHLAQDTKFGDKLNEFLFEYAKGRKAKDGKFENEYMERLYDARQRYKNIESYQGTKGLEKIRREVAADLVGDYLFNDRDFVEHLAKDRNLFQRIWNDIKRMANIVTAGSEEAKQLERIKKTFEDAYRKAGKGVSANGEVQHSLTIKRTDGTVEELADARGLTNEQAVSYLYQAKSGTLRRETYIPVRKDTPQVIIDTLAEAGENVENLSLVMQVRKAQQSMSTENQGGRNGKHGNNVRKHALSPEEVVEIVNNLDNPSMVILQTNRHGKNREPLPNNVAVFVEYNKGGKEGVAVIEFESSIDPEFIGTEYGDTSYHTVVTVFEPDVERDGMEFDYAEELLANPDNIELDIKRRQLAGSATGEKHPNTSSESPSFGDIVPHSGNGVKGYSVSDSDGNAVKENVMVMDGGSVARYSISTWTPETQSKVRENLLKAGYEGDRVDKWIQDTNSIASVIAADKDRLGFVAADNQTMLKNNQEYVKTLDASTLCAKRLTYQGTFDAIQHRMPNTVLSSDDLIELANMMKEHGVETPCAVCYVESRRRHLGKFAQEWLDKYDGAYKPSLDEVTTSDGLEALRKSHPDTYADFTAAMDKKGSANPKVVQLRTEYRNEILSLTPAQIRKIEAIGGLRVQSFSDFETPHLLDMMQAVMDMSAKGLSSQAYTKVSNFAWVFGDTGIKINLSLIAEGDGFDANGNLAFSSVEGMDFNEAMRLREAYSDNVGTIIVGANDKHILACMADDRIDFIIPFHRSGWGRKELELMGMSSYEDYTYGQKEHDLATGKGLANLYPPDYWDYNLSGKENAERYLNLCAITGREPKFSQFLVNNGDGSYSLQPDGSTDGYWKTLIDFKMYNNEGVGAAQQKVQPNFNMEEAYRVLAEYEGGANKLPVAKDVVEEFVAKHQGVQRSISEVGKDYAPTGSYNIYGNDVYLRQDDDIAPFRLAPETVAENATVEAAEPEVAPVPAKEAPVKETPKKAPENVTTGDEKVNAKLEGLRTELENVRRLREEAAASYDEDIARLQDELHERQTSKAAKLQSLQTERANNQQNRDDSIRAFDEEIARRQAQYDAKKNKNTKAANNLLRIIERLKRSKAEVTASYDNRVNDLGARITKGESDIQRSLERLRRLKGNIDAEYAKRISDLEKRIEKVDSKTYRTAEQRRTKMEEHTSFWQDLVGDTSTWRDLKLGLSYKTKTMRRFLREVVRDGNGNRDFAKADAIYDALETKYDHNEAMLKQESQKLKESFFKLKLTKAEDTYAHMLGELRHNPETQLTKEDVDAFCNKHKSKIDTEKVDKAINETRKLYDDLQIRLNEVLKQQGMTEIPYRKGYFPHFTNPKQGWLGKLLNWKTIDTEIPTSIAGLTEQFEPQRSWQSFNKERKSDDTDYSLYQGLDSYIHGALDWIYHIDDLQSRRALENYLRSIHSEEKVRAKIEEIKANEDYDYEEAQAQIELVLNEARNPLNNLVTELRNRTNTLANKKASMDRQWEEGTNRTFYSTMTNLNNRVTANMVVGSISSALTNFIPIVQSWHQVSPLYTVRGLGDYVRSVVRDDGMVQKSDYLTNRLMEEEALYQTGWDKVIDKAAFMMNVVDSITSQTVWRSKYLQNLNEGMSEAMAIRDADQFAKNLMAGRSRGNAPSIFDAKNPWAKIFTSFQLEVANQYGYMFKDVPQDSTSKAKLVGGYAAAFIGAYVYNALYSSLVGRDAAFDPISIFADLFRDLGWIGDDEEEEPKDVILNFADNILEEVPYVGGLFGGGRIPIQSAIPYGGTGEPVRSLMTDLSEKDYENLAKEALKPLYYLVLPVGGGQAKKTNEGIAMFSDKHPVTGSYTSSGKLRYPVEKTFGNVAQAALFGQYANKNAREYFDEDIAPLGEKQIQEYQDLDLPISEYWDIRQGMKGLDKLEEKADYIDSLDLPIGKKNTLINNIAGRKEPIDMTGYGLYDSLEEFDFANKYPEKYSFLYMNGISYAQYKTFFDDDKKNAVDWAVENPEKQSLAKAVAGDVFGYRQYTSELNDIKADKDSDGKTISGSKKNKVIDYINGLDLDYGQKIILFRSMYSSEEDRETYNAEIVEYLNTRDDLSYEEIVEILKALEFTVTSDGRVYWD